MSGELRAEAGSDIVDDWSYLDYLDVRDGARGMNDGRLEPRRRSVHAGGAERRCPLATVYVSSNNFSTVGVDAALGPASRRADDGSQRRAEAVIGHWMW